MWVSPACSALAQSTTCLSVPTGFPPGKWDWVHRGTRSSSQALQISSEPGWSQCTNFFVCLFEVKNLYLCISKVCRKNLHFLFTNLYVYLAAMQVLGFLSLPVFHVSAAFVFPLSYRHALCPRGLWKKRLHEPLFLVSACSQFIQIDCISKLEVRYTIPNDTSQEML